MMETPFSPHGLGGRPVTGIALAGIFLALAGCSARAAQSGAKPPAPVTTATAIVGPQALTVSGLGHVQGLDTAVVRAQTTGQILSVGFAEGQAVRLGQALAQLDPRPLQAALAQDEAALARDRAAQANAADNLTRSAPLVGQGLASAQQVEGYKSQASQLAAVVAGDRAAIQRDRLTLAYTTIRAPISGVIGVRQTDPGNVASPGDAAGIATIAQIQPIAVMFTLPQSAITGLRAAMASAGAAGLGVDALAQGDGQVLDHGRLTVIDNHVDDASGTVLVKAVFPNAHRLLWPGELITARVSLGNHASGVTVPASAIQSNVSGSYVWTVAANGRAAMRPVVTGARLGAMIAISRGLAGGEQVVTDGQFGLAPGAALTVVNVGSAPPSLKADDPERLGLQS
jgi:multidrug efflux system membrane fusion protein